MIYLQRKIKMKYTGDDQYLPEGIPRGKPIPVIGIETRRREAMKNDKTVIVEDLFYLVINDHGKLISIASFNCQTLIDESAEWNVQQAIELLRNATIVGKVLSEKLTGKGSKGVSETSNESIPSDT